MTEADKKILQEWYKINDAYIQLGKALLNLKDADTEFIIDWVKNRQYICPKCYWLKPEWKRDPYVPCSCKIPE